MKCVCVCCEACVGGGMCEACVGGGGHVRRVCGGYVRHVWVVGEV